MKKKIKQRRFVLFFQTPLVLQPNPNRRKRYPQIMTRTAKGPVDAYRKATGWLGQVYTGGGYMRQQPAKQVGAFLKSNSIEEMIELYKTTKVPPMAFIVPLGEW